MAISLVVPTRSPSRVVKASHEITITTEVDGQHFVESKRTGKVLEGPYGNADRALTRSKVRSAETGVGDPEYIRNIITINEGTRSEAYQDTKWSKKPTIGVGFNLNRSDAPEKIAKIGADINSLRSKKTKLSEKQIKHLFDLSMLDAYNDARAFVPEFNNLSASRQAVLVDMAFNLGRKRLNKFKRMRNAIAQGDYERASQEIMNSAYAKQLPERAGRNALLMLSPLSELTPPRRGR